MKSVPFIIALLAGAATGAADIVEIRGQDAVLSGEIVRLTHAGVELKTGENRPNKVVSWDRVRAVVGGKLTPDASHEALGLSLMRGRMRLERGDLDMAAEVLEPLYAQLSTASNVTGPTGYLLAECVLHERLESGRTDAVFPWLEAVQARRGQESAEWLGDHPKLPRIVESATSLCVRLPPIYGGATPQAAIRSLSQKPDWSRLTGEESAVKVLALAYLAAAKFEAGEPVVTVPPIDAKSSEGEKLVIDIVLSRVGEADARDHARTRLVRRLEAIDRNEETREGSEGAVVEDRSWQKPWLHAAIGRSMLRESSLVIRKQGVVELLTVPAVHFDSQPRLAELCLVEALNELRLQGEKAEALSALENELKRVFHVERDESAGETQPATPSKETNNQPGAGHP